MLAQTDTRFRAQICGHVTICNAQWLCLHMSVGLIPNLELSQPVGAAAFHLPICKSGACTTLKYNNITENLDCLHQDNSTP